MRRNLVSTKKSGGRRESESIKARGDIKVGMIFDTEKIMNVADLQAVLQKANHRISWALPEIKEDQIFFPVQYSTEETERATNETKRDYLTRLFGINIKLLENILECIAEKLDNKQLPGVTKVTPIANFRSTLT